MQKTRHLFSVLFAVFFLFSCKTVYQPQSVEFKDYKIAQQEKHENALTKMLQPYSDSVNRNMNDVIAVAGITLEKKSPEGTLGNVLADAMLAMAKEKFSTSIDASFINSGGIRLPSIPAGNITRGKIYELSPFDNMIVLLKIDAKTLMKFLDLTASKGGWPCSGIKYQIKNSKAVNIEIGGAPIDETASYTIAMVDYVANGGDNCDMLKGIPQQNKGYLLRDAVIEYFTVINKKGQKIAANIEKRVSNAD